MAKAKYTLGTLIKVPEGYGEVQAVITTASGYSYLLEDGTTKVTEEEIVGAYVPVTERKRRTKAELESEA